MEVTRTRSEGMLGWQLGWLPRYPCSWSPEDQPGSRLAAQIHVPSIASGREPGSFPGPGVSRPSHVRPCPFLRLPLTSPALTRLCPKVNWHLDSCVLSQPSFRNPGMHFSSLFVIFTSADDAFHSAACRGNPTTLLI